MNPVGLALLVGGIVVFGGIFYITVLNEGTSSCPGHWHGTFAVFVPADSTGTTPVRVDYGAPLAPSGQQYYQLNVDPAMSVAAHMHQSGSERGSQAHGPAQFHFEASGKCVGIATALKTIDTSLTATNLKVSNAHGLTQAGDWSNHGNQTVRIFWQSQDASKQWVWGEVKPSSYLHTQPKDGESFLVTYGHYTDAQVQSMESQIVAPISRAAPPAPTATATLAATTNTTGKQS